jgi:hypothetical protein
VSALYFTDSLPHCPRESLSPAWQEHVRLELTIPLILWLCCALGYGYLVAAGRPEGARKVGRETGRAAVDEVSDEEDEEEDSFDVRYREELQEREKRVRGLWPF